MERGIEVEREGYSCYFYFEKVRMLDEHCNRNKMKWKDIRECL